MTSKVVSAAVVLAVLLVGPAAAQGKDPAHRAAQQRRALSRHLPKGKVFTSGGRQYRIVGGLRAVLRAPEEPTHQTLARAGATAADLVETKGNHLVIRQASIPGPVAAQMSVNDTVTLPVAVSARTGNFAVVPGSITVRLEDAADAGAVAEAHGVRLILSAPHLSTAFYQVASGQDVQAAAAALGKDFRVVSAEIEIKEHFDEPQ